MGFIRRNTRRLGDRCSEMLSLALCTLGLQPGRLPLTRTAPLARAVSPQLQLAQLDVEGTNVEVICSALNQCFPAAHTH